MHGWLKYPPESKVAKSKTPKPDRVLVQDLVRESLACGRNPEAETPECRSFPCSVCWGHAVSFPSPACNGFF
jgi:hypothetical protein